MTNMLDLQIFFPPIFHGFLRHREFHSLLVRLSNMFFSSSFFFSSPDTEDKDNVLNGRKYFLKILPFPGSRVNLSDVDKSHYLEVNTPVSIEDDRKCFSPWPSERTL